MATPARPVRRSWWPAAALTLLVIAAVGWTAWARIAPPRPIVAVAVFDNETGNPAFDPLARTAADIMVERLTGFGPQNIGVIGNTPSLRQARAVRDPARVQVETGAGYLVFGQVQPDDVGVRLVVHLDPSRRRHASLGNPRGPWRRGPHRHRAGGGGQIGRGRPSARDRSRSRRPSVHALRRYFAIACALQPSPADPRWTQRRQVGPDGARSQ